MRDERTLEQRLTGLRQPISSAQQSADLTTMASVRPGRFASKVRVAAAFAVGLLLGSTGLAAANALPDPAQHVAHQALDRVGLEVPDPERYHGAECGEVVQKNHGGYVKVDKALAQSDCGKPVGAGGDGAEDGHEAADKAGKAEKAAKGPCQGKPPWAGNKTMMPEERAAAQVEREAQCGTDDDAEVDDAGEARSAEVPAEATTTTTAVADTTTTTEATTTTVEDTTSTTDG